MRLNFLILRKEKKTYRTYQREFLIKLEGFNVVKMDLLLSSPSLLWLQRQKHQNKIHIPKSLHVPTAAKKQYYKLTAILSPVGYAQGDFLHFLLPGVAHPDPA